MTAATNIELHLIEPLGFELSDKYLKRAGLDYWPEVRLRVHSSWEVFLEETATKREQLWFLSTHAEKSYHRIEYKPNDVFVFGNEASGLAKKYHDEYPERRLRIPMENANVRSLNLANAVSIVLYEARRQLGILDAQAT